MGSETHRKVLEELKELFGPAFGPAVEAYGRSLAERLCGDDEGFVSGVARRFEEGRARGEFPALSGLLAGATEEQVEEFFESGWTRVALPTPAPAVESKPWDFAPWGGDIYSHLLPDMQEKAAKALEEALR